MKMKKRVASQCSSPDTPHNRKEIQESRQSEGQYQRNDWPVPATQQLQFPSHPANIGAWTFGPVVACV